MKAAVITAPFKFEIKEMQKPIPSPGELLIRIKSVGICGSDVHGMEAEGGIRRRPGLIMGHEAAGQIEDVGEGVQDWQPGDRVAINPQLSCGYCYACERGLKHMCQNGVVLGSSRVRMTHGTMQEYIIVPQRQVNRLPDNVSYDEGCTLDFVGNAMHVLNRAEGKFGDTYVIIGTGAIGLVLVQLAKLRGAGKIIAVDTSQAKLELARKYGADRLINPLQEDVIEVVLNETGGFGADISIEAVGLPATYETAVKVLKIQGKLMALGFAANEIQIPIQPLLFKEISIIGCTGFSFEAAPVLNMISDGRIDVKTLITHKYSLEKIETGFESILDRSQNTIKVVINP
jgi:2-desacetyl-2-hydroxyethyl bacteriochlorophyllide A dehydrogenase